MSWIAEEAEAQWAEELAERGVTCDWCGGLNPDCTNCLGTGLMIPDDEEDG